ncbi:MAG: hypothetical protein AB3N14_02530 [Flavobacteriaceae bacterium]
MMEDELITIWQSSPNEERLKFEKSRFIIDLQSSLDRLQRSWKYMEWRELIAALIVIPVFGYKAFTFPDLLAKLGAIWIVFATLYISFRLLRIRKYKPSAFTESYLDYLHKTKQYLEIQKKLLNSVMYWYFSPIAFGLLLLFINDYESVPKFLLNIGVLVIMGVIVYYLNKRAAQKSIEPKLKKIDELIALLEAP